MPPSLTVRLVSIPLLVPFATRFGTERSRDALILTYRSKGVEAYSECVTSAHPGYSIEDNESALRAIKDRLARLLKEEPSPREFSRAVSRTMGDRMAKASVEMLLWDFHCKLRLSRMADALGKTKGYAEVGVSLGFDTPDALVEGVCEALDQGYRRVKLKIRKGQEYATVKRVRTTFPDAELSVDANGDYAPEDTETLQSLDEFGLAYIEEPLGGGDLEEHAKLAGKISTPICLDESIPTVESARKAVEIGAAKVFNIKPGRMGGLANALEAIAVVRKGGGSCWVGGMLETGVGRAFNIALASLEAVDLPGDTSPNGRYFKRDIVRNPFEMKGGVIAPGRGLGAGVEIDERFLDACTKEKWRIL